MTHPTIHTNGTAKSALIKQYENATLALNLAVMALDQAAPNQRDYYPQGAAAFAAAMAAHKADLSALQGVLQHVQYLWESVDGQEG